MSAKRTWLRKLLFFAPVAVGIAVFVVLVRSKAPPPLAPPVEQIRKVRVVRAQILDVVPAITVFGNVLPERTWDAIAQVAGQVVQINARLRDGNMVTKDAVLLTIDPAGYDLRRAEIDAQLAEIGVTEENNRTLLAIEQSNLALAERSLTRKQDLKNKGATSQAIVDQAEQGVLARRAIVQNLRNRLSLIPTQRRVLEARLAQAKRDLQHTTIRAPFDIRIADLKIETGQYVGVGQTLFTGDSIDRVEITAQVPMHRMQPLMLGHAVLDKVTSYNFTDAVAMLAQIKATVRLEVGTGHIEWPARVVRFDDTIDPKTRTIGVVVAVDNPYENIQPGARPPLVKGMFVKVELKGAPQPGSIVVPAQAVRQGSVYLISSSGKLKSQSVKVRFYQGAAAILFEGLAGGETVIVSDLVPAIEGMRVDGVVDADLAQRTTAAGMDRAP